MKLSSFKLNLAPVISTKFLLNKKVVTIFSCFKSISTFLSHSLSLSQSATCAISTTKKHRGPIPPRPRLLRPPEPPEIKRTPSNTVAALTHSRRWSLLSRTGVLQGAEVQESCRCLEEVGPKFQRCCSSAEISRKTFAMKQKINIIVLLPLCSSEIHSPQSA